MVVAFFGSMTGRNSNAHHGALNCNLFHNKLFSRVISGPANNILNRNIVDDVYFKQIEI